MPTLSLEKQSDKGGATGGGDVGERQMRDIQEREHHTQAKTRLECGARTTVMGNDSIP